jgi:CP family cyanate transporter-like MFS transporter
MGGLAFPTPWLATRFGRDNVILAALAILTLATLCRAFANSWIVLLLATAGIGAGIAVVGALIAGFVKKSFPRHTSLLMGVYAMSLGLGSTLAAGSAGPIATATASWRFSSGIFAIFGLTGIAAWLYISRREPATSLGDAPAPASVPHRRPWGYPAAWFAALYVATNNILFFGFIAWTATMYRELGVSNAQASTLLASFTIAFMIGNLTAGLISRNTDRRRVITVFAGLVLIGSVITAHVPLLMPYLFIPVIAFGIGGSFTLGMTLPLDHTATVGEANTWTAFVMGIGYSTGAFGPLIFGHARDLTGSFTAPLWVMGGVAVVMLSLAPFLKPDREAKAHP